MSASDFRRIARDALKGKWKTVLLLFLVIQLFAETFGLSELREYLTPINGYDVGVWHVMRPDQPITNMYSRWRLLMVIAELGILIVHTWLKIGAYTLVCRLLEGAKPSWKDFFRTDRIKDGLLLGMIELVPVAALLITAKITSLLILVYPIIIFSCWFYIHCGMVSFLLAENSELDVFHALEYSFQCMRGNVFDYICLWFSFLGWIVLKGVVNHFFGLVIGEGLMGIFLNMLFAVCAAAPLEAYIFTAYAAFYRYINEEAPGSE